MKKINILFVVLAACLTIQTTNAQLFVGGNIYVSSSSSKDETNGVTTDNPKTFEFGINPRAGFFLSDKLAVGAGIGVNIESENNRQDPEVKTSSTTFNFNPFARYYLMNVDKFSVFGEGGVVLGLGSSKSKSGGVTVDGPNIFDFTFYVMPAISYDLTDNFTIEAGIGGLFINSYSAKDDNDDKYKESNIDFNLNLDNIFFGAIYKF